MNTRNRHSRSVLFVIIGFLVGLALLLVFLVNQKTPEHSESLLARTPVAVIEVKALPVRIEARGHGIARPTESWRAIANVSGRVVQRHPNLESGAFIEKGTLLLQLDPSRYELRVAEANAEFVQLAAEEKNTTRLLEVEQQALVLAEQELDRIEQLAATGSVSSSQLDNQRRQTLAQQQAVTSLENILALMPARLERASIRLAQANQDLDDTKFIAPYDLRLSTVNTELEQFVNIGQQLFEAENLSAVEVEARIPFSMLRRLLTNLDLSELSLQPSQQSNFVDFSLIDANLELVSAPDIKWEGRVVRVASGLDPVTRAARVIVRVDNPWEHARLPDQPPLQSEMYTRVQLSVTSSVPFLVIPSSAIHQGEVYLADNDDRLIRRKVDVLFEQRGLAAIGSGLNVGDRVVLNDLQPAINGMHLLVRHDVEAEQALAEIAKSNRNNGDAL